MLENSFQTLPAWLYAEVEPTPVGGARLVHVQPGLRKELGLHVFSDSELLTWLNGQSRIPGDQRIATRYAGHQFGVWAGQLGDGRAISLGEFMTPARGRLEVQVKGAGPTPFSRRGDGRAVLRSSVREYLCSIAMKGLGIPTSEVLALVSGTEPVERETTETAALVARVFPTNIRFGHFELCRHFDRPGEFDALTQYTRELFFPECTIEEMLREITRRTAHLMAAWQDVGFCHGVMNTDNFSILGFTLDYGPFGFLEDTRLDHVCNHSDHEGRYAYHRQPDVGVWNLERFLACFRDFVPVERLTQILDAYFHDFKSETERRIRLKLGLLTARDSDSGLFLDLLRILHDRRADFAWFFRNLAHPGLGRVVEIPGEDLQNWLKRYRERLVLEGRDDGERSLAMLRNNPKFILRNYIAQEVIEAVSKGSDREMMDWIRILENPFDEHPGFEGYAEPTPQSFKHFEISCSS
jgi:uncharacterized protein YdiU (UPF0061 family)